MKTKSKVIFSVKARLLLISIVPVFLMSIVLTRYASTSIRQGMQEEAFVGLKAMSLSLQEMYEMLDPAGYAQDSDGNVTKGSLPVSSNYEYVDDLKALTGFDLTVFYEDTRVATSLKDAVTGDRLVGTKASDEVIKTVLQNGEFYQDTAVVINGEPYYGFYSPVVQDGQVVAMIFAGKPSHQIDLYINEKIKAISAISMLVLVVVGVFAVSFSLSLSNGITKAERVIYELGQGNLNVSADEKAKKRTDEVGSMTRELDTLIEELASSIGSAKRTSAILFESGHSLEETAMQTSITTEEISRAVEGISLGSTEQAEEVENASGHISHMGEIIVGIVQNADELAQASVQMKEASDKSAGIIEQLAGSNQRTAEAIEKIGYQVHATNDSAQMIRQAVELITSISEETNLLSLNATIEAARAGEHGRGFAVVATQIQKLAEESNASAKKIGDIINGLIQESEATVQVMDEVNEIMEEQRARLEETTKGFSDLETGVNSTAKGAEIIESHTIACDEARVKMIDVITHLAAISEENAASTEETSASMQEMTATVSLLADAAKNLQELSANLEKDMSFFKV